MYHRSLFKAAILTLLLICVILNRTTVEAQSEFPRISFLDPYWVHHTYFEDYDHYWPQIDSCGFTHIVTDGDAVSLNNSAGFYLLNAILGDAWRYARGVEWEYPVGGVGWRESYFDPDDMETGDNIQDGFEGPWVFRMRCDYDSLGVVFDSSFAGWHQPMKGYYHFVFTMKMVGDTSVADPVAKVSIWEEVAKSEDFQSEHGWLLWEEPYGVSLPPLSRQNSI